MSMEILRALVLVSMMVAAAALDVAAATTYTVGAPDGLWGMQTNYADWVASRTFHPGDKISESSSASFSPIRFHFRTHAQILNKRGHAYGVSIGAECELATGRVVVAAFTYSPELHEVVEVSKAGYDACSSANNISAFRTGRQRCRRAHRTRDALLPLRTHRTLRQRHEDPHRRRRCCRWLVAYQSRSSAHVHRGLVGRWPRRHASSSASCHHRRAIIVVADRETTLLLGAKTRPLWFLAVL
jgi:hypothetical protein